MKQSSKRLTSMLLSLLFLVAAFIVFFDLIQPAYSDLQTEKGTEVSTQNLLATEQQLVSQAKNLVSQYDSGSATQQNLSLAMPSTPDIAGVLAQVYGIAQNNNITVQDVQISVPAIQVGSQTQGASGDTTLTLSQITKPLGSVTLQVTAFGTYEGLKSFLVNLETNIRIFDVTALSIQASNAAPAAKGAASSADFFTYTISITTYYQYS